MRRINRFVVLAVVLLSASVVAFATGETEPQPTGPRTITLWTTEEQPERMKVQEGIADRFEAMTGITVEVVPVSENLMGQRATAAFSAGRLPDIIYHPLNFTLNLNGIPLRVNM